MIDQTQDVALIIASLIETLGDSERGDTAIVITVKGRYFYEYKNNRIKTAWSLPGAKLFNIWDTDKIIKIVSLLSKKGKACKFHRVGITK